MVGIALVAILIHKHTHIHTIGQPQGLPPTTYKPMNKKVIATLLIGCALGAGGNYYLQQRPVKVTIVKPQISQLQSTILATGQVKNNQQTHLHNENAGIVGRVLEEGTRVNKGQIIAFISDKDAEALLQQQQANVKSSQLKLTRLQTIERQQAELKVEQARILLKQAKRQLSDTQALAEQQLTSQNNLITAQETLSLREKELATTLLQQQAAQAQGLDEQTAISQLQQAQALLAQSQIRQQRQTIISPFDGVITERKVSVGQYVKQGEAIVAISPQQAAEIIANVDERWLPQLSLNQQGSVIADAFPQQSFKAQISYIAPTVDSSRGTIEIRLQSQQWPSFLQEGMTVSLELISKSFQKTVVIPSKLLQQTDNQYWVWLAKNQQAQRKNVRIGLRHLDQVQIIEGLDENSPLIDSPTPLQAKQTIQAR